MKIRHFFIHSYLFWAFFSLVNIQLLWAMVVPFLFLAFVPRLLEVFPFLWSPAVAASTFSLVVLLAATAATRRWHAKPYVPVFLAYVFNSAFLLVFLAVADYRKNAAIESRLATRHPDCIHVNSIFKSIQNAGGDFNFYEHALFTENGKTFYWSFRAMDFFEGHDALDRNFPCVQSKYWITLVAPQTRRRFD